MIDGDVIIARFKPNPDFWTCPKCGTNLRRAKGGQTSFLFPGRIECLGDCAADQPPQLPLGFDAFAEPSSMKAKP